jgi:uncharacterized membrane protein
MILQHFLLSISEFVGHLHPLLVHLPIGILLLGCLFIWQSRKDRYAHLQPAINIILLLGMISSIASCVTGLLLSGSGDYDEELVSRHQWMGISVAVVSVVIYFLRRKFYQLASQLFFALLLTVLIFITGHLGGSLTHGTDYLSSPLKDIAGDTELVVRNKPIPDVQEALLYGDIIKPIFQSKCYGCHGTAKQKGKLRLDQPEWIIKGGKDGAVVVSGKSAESELIKRVILPREEEHHMAPKEKPQLTSAERSLLSWWIDNGADFTKKVKDFPQPEKIRPILISLQKQDEEPKAFTEIPSTAVEKADEAVLLKMRKAGVVIMPVSQNSNYLEANFITVSAPGDSLISLLPELKKQLVRLKLSGVPLRDRDIVLIGECINIRRLELDHTGITDSGLVYLKPLTELQSLNLVSTPITAAGLKNLSSLKKIRVIYLYQTRIVKTDWKELGKTFSHVSLDSGGYHLPFIASDTVVVKPR